MKKTLYLILLTAIAAIALSACTEKPPIDLEPLELSTEAGSNDTRISLNTEGHKASIELVNAPEGVQVAAGGGAAPSNAAVINSCLLSSGCKLKVGVGVLAGKYSIRLKVHLIDLDKDVFTDLILTVRVSVSLDTKGIVIAPGASYKFKATIAGAKEKTVSWSATGGTVDASGNYTAGSVPGKYEIVVTTTTSPVKTAKAQIEIKQTKLSFSVEPSNAIVQVFDKNSKKVAQFVGSKNYVNFKPGKYRVKTTLVGYKSVEKGIVVNAAENNLVKIKLIISTGIKLDVYPEDADVLIEGPDGYKRTFRGDVLIGGFAAGTYKLNISAKGYRSNISEIKIVKDQIKDLKIKLEKKIGLDLKPKIKIGISINQPVGTVMTVKVGVSGYTSKLDVFSLKAYWKKAGQAKFEDRAEFYFDEDRGLIELLLPELGEGENVLKLVVDEKNIIKEDDEENNVLLQSFYGGDHGDNNPPSVIIYANPKTGKKPLEVSFTAKASDADGKVVAYEWDFDGDGKVDSELKTSVKHIYTLDGVYHASIRVKDDKGAFGSDEIVITVGNPPVDKGSLQIDVTPNDAQVIVAGPKSYRRSFVGDKTLSDLIAGQYQIEVKKNGYATKTITKTVVGGKTAKAIVSLSQATGTDLKPKILLGVSTTQPVGTVMTVKVGVDGYKSGMNIFSLKAYWKKAGETRFGERAEFYYDEDRGWIELLLPSLLVGENTLKLVADAKNDIAEDNEDNNVLEQIFVGTAGQQNSPPTVSLKANPSTGTYPLTVNFIATATDSDGKIVKYEWDFNGDGQIDKLSGASESYVFDDNGRYVVKVTVTDDDGAKASAQASVNVTIPSDGKKPSLSWISPGANDVITSVRQLKVDVNSVDAATVTYKIENRVIVQGLSAPYTYEWSPKVSDNGVTKTLIAEACDIDGCSSAEIVVGIDVIDRAQWVRSLPYSASGNPIVRGDMVFGGLNVGLIYSVKDDGNVWVSEKFLPAAISNDIEVDREYQLAYIHSQTGYIYAVSLKTGELSWSKQVGINYGTYTAPSPVSLNGLVYVAGGPHNNCLDIYDATGTLVNTESLCFDGWLLPTPVVKGGFLYLMEENTSTKSILYEISDTGEILSKSEKTFIALEADTLSVDDDAIVAASTFRTVVKFNPDNLGTTTLSTGLVHKTSVLPTPNCYIANVDKMLSCLDKSDGHAKWSYRLALYPLINAAYDPQRNKVYAVGYNGEVVALDEATGELSWSYDLNDLETTGGVRNTPVILGDTLVIVRDKTIVGLNLNY